MDLIDELRRKINRLFYYYKQAFLKANQKKNIITKNFFFLISFLSVLEYRIKGSGLEVPENVREISS